MHDVPRLRRAPRGLGVPLPARAGRAAAHRHAGPRVLVRAPRADDARRGAERIQPRGARVPAFRATHRARAHADGGHHPAASPRVEGMGMRAALYALIAVPGPALADASEIGALVGSAEKMGVVAVLIVGLYFAWQEIKRGRGHAHTLRNA